MKKQYLLIFALILLTVTSCEKDDTQPSGGGIAPRIITEDCRIKSTLEYEKGDTSFSTKYEYVFLNDSLQRVVSSYSGNYINTVNYLQDKFSNTTFLVSTDFFNQADTIEELRFDVSNRLIEVLSYDDNKLESRIRFKNYSQNLPTVLDIETFYGTPENGTYQLSWQNGNLVKINLIRLNGNSVSNRLVVDIAYDQNLNPFKGIYSLNESIWSYYSNNNTTQIIYRENTSTSIDNFQYSVAGRMPLRQELNYGNGITIKEYEYSCD